MNSPVNFTYAPIRGSLRMIIFLGALIWVTWIWYISIIQETKTLWIIDTSLSMSVSDVLGSGGIMISRLDAARMAMLGNIGTMGGEHAIMSMALGAKLELPFTTDMSAIHETIMGLQEVKYGGGSDPTFLWNSLSSLYGRESHLSIVWLTDGEFSGTGVSFSGWINPPSISIVAIGTRAGGMILEGYNSDGLPRYKESDGKRVISKRDDAQVTSLASELSAKTYFLDTIIDTPQFSSSVSTRDMHSFSWMLLGIFICLVGLFISPFRMSPTICEKK